MKYLRLCLMIQGWCLEKSRKQLVALPQRWYSDNMLIGLPYSCNSVPWIPWLLARSAEQQVRIKDGWVMVGKFAEVIPFRLLGGCIDLSIKSTPWWMIHGNGRSSFSPQHRNSYYWDYCWWKKLHINRLSHCLPGLLHLRWLAGFLPSTALAIQPEKKDESFQSISLMIHD